MQSFAFIEFTPTGEILNASAQFCSTMGYALAEIKGQHHRMFVEPEFAKSTAYVEFWRRLGSGNFDTGEYKRIAKSGAEVWLQASYTPVKNSSGKVVKVVKLALDVTAQKALAARNESILTAINRSQAVIEFEPDGTIVDANENFLKTVGYGLDEIKGRKHAMFVEPDYSASPEYVDFWKRLKAGEFLSAEFNRRGKGGKSIWLEASYNPIIDPNGQVKRVVKFATDLTTRMANVGLVGSALAEMAKGDLRTRIGEKLIPSLDQLRVDFNAAADRLQTALVSVNAAASAIETGTSEIGASTQDLSQRTEQQAASLEETAAALDQITATVKNTAVTAGRVRQVVAAAKQDAERSGVVVTETVTAMSAIEHSSREIGQIIGVIDEIAFQTNLLALNAGVEAARAGDAGRGFAVVASEVRALAQRSADAAKQIKSLIAKSESHVSRGVALVGEAGSTLQKIAGQVAEINAQMSEIAASAEEQSTALTQVNTAVNQMDQMTQQNAAMVEETTAASQHLAASGRDLSRMMSDFRLGQAAGEVASMRSTPRLSVSPRGISRGPMVVGSAARKAAP